MSCWPLIRLIQDAHDTFAAGKVDPLNPAFPLTPIEGNPAWIDSIRYTIDARTEGPESVAMMRGPIMQTLLEDRFHLKVHRETREVPVYMMAVAEGGPKLRPAKDGSCTPLDPTDLTQSPNPIGGKPWCVVTPPVRRGSTWVWDVGGMSLDVFSKLIHPDGKRVINRTGLTGTFDIHLEWDTNDPNSAPPDSGAASEPVGRSLTVAIRKQLGLQFDRGKGPQEFLIIDHVEKPTEN